MPKWMLLLTTLIVWSLPAIAAETFKVPMTVVPGSVNLTPPGGPSAPATLPLSQFGSDAGCSGTFTAEVVDGGLEVELDGAASNCTLHFNLSFDAQFVAPEVGGSGTMIRLDGVPVESDFASLYHARARWIATGDGGTSSSPNGRFYCQYLRTDYLLGQGGPDPATGDPLLLTAAIPGDTVTCPFYLEFELASSGVVTNGNLRMRYEFLVTVPEPSASLSLSLGMAWLAGLSMMRAGV